MPKEHVVQQGECLSSIAFAEGFDDWRTIYGDPANADFRIKRPNPNLIFPDDVVLIPDKTPAQFQVATGATHAFNIHVSRTLLRIRLDNESPLNHRLTVEDEVKEGSVQPGEVIEQDIPGGALTGELIAWPVDFDTPDSAGDAAITWNLLIGHLDPPDTVSGVQARLLNLGFDPGPVDGVSGPKTRAAIRDFQADHPPLDVDGDCGPRTTAALIDAYGM